MDLSTSQIILIDLKAEITVCNKIIFVLFLTICPLKVKQLTASNNGNSPLLLTIVGVQNVIISILMLPRNESSTCKVDRVFFLCVHEAL